MSQLWSGDISTDDPVTCIQGNARPPDADSYVQIWAPDSSSTPIPLSQDAKLHFLSLVEVARIHLYLAAGPSCDVSTGSEATTRWLTESLLDDEWDASREPWWSHVGRQSENGILLGVEIENGEERGTRNVITEVLLYAAVTRPNTALPTPPTSSSPVAPDDDVADVMGQGGKTVKVYALPLCSNVIGRAKISMEICPPIPTEFQSTGQACFLPNTHDPVRVMQPRLQKRQSISTLFEDATKKRRKLKGRGGGSISQAMAGIDRPASHHELLEKQDAPQPQQNNLRRKSLSRASSMTPIVGPEYPRPASRSGLLANGKRSSLHRVESAISPRDSATPSDADGSCAQQNKAALTKVIMAGMRLHGLQQKKKPSSRSQAPSQVTSYTETNGAANEAEDEYKLVYHQTLKAAMFTFRNNLSALAISPETMRDVVDRLLIMFCTDPMTGDRGPDGSECQEFEANNRLPSSNPFDKPSSQARFSNVARGCHTPTVNERWILRKCGDA